MADPWQYLRDGGVPIAAPRSGTMPEASVLAASAREAIARGPAARDAEALAAWLLAWRDHWPSAFTASFGDDRDRIVAWAIGAAIDDGRYVKLRRIALENLATIL